VPATATPARRRWDQRWDDDGEDSQWGSATASSSCTSSATSGFADGGLGTGRGSALAAAGDGDTPWAAADAASYPPVAVRLGLAASPPTVGATTGADTDGSTDSADSASEGAKGPPSALASGRVSPEGEGEGQEARPAKKGWVVWTLEGDSARDHLRVPAPAHPQPTPSTAVPTPSALVPDAVTSSRSSSSRYPFTAEQALQLAELLYVLRPAVHAWARHYLLQWHTRHGHGNSSDSGRGSNDGEGREGEGMAARRVRHAEELLAWALALALELFSVQLTAIALSMARERSARLAVAADVDHADHADDTDGIDAARREERKAQALLAASLPLSHAFDTELSRRKFALFYNLVRSPVFDRATMPFLQVLHHTLSLITLTSYLTVSYPCACRAPRSCCSTCRC